jgi:hypothetical protein
LTPLGGKLPILFHIEPPKPFSRQGAKLAKKTEYEYRRNTEARSAGFGVSPLWSEDRPWRAWRLGVKKGLEDFRPSGSQ